MIISSSSCLLCFLQLPVICYPRFSRSLLLNCYVFSWLDSFVYGTCLGSRRSHVKCFICHSKGVEMISSHNFALPTGPHQYQWQPDTEAVSQGDPIAQCHTYVTVRLALCKN